MASGRIGARQAQVITDAVGALSEQVPAAEKAATERFLVQQAPGTDPRRLAALARARAARIDPRGSGDLAGAERAAKAARDLVLVADGAGGQVLRGRLDPEGAAIVAAALDPLCAPQPPARTAPPA